MPEMQGTQSGGHPHPLGLRELAGLQAMREPRPRPHRGGAGTTGRFDGLRAQTCGIPKGLTPHSPFPFD